MPQANRRHGPRQEPRRQAQLNQKSLSELTTKIDKSLQDAAAKPTNGSKRKRGSGTTSSGHDAPRKLPARKAGLEASPDAPPRDVDTGLSESALLQEILALGGDEEDLALIDNVESDSETEVVGTSNTVVDHKLQTELRAFAEQLGLQTLQDSTSRIKPDDTGADSTKAPMVSQAKRTPTTKEQFTLEPRADWHAADLDSLPEPSPSEMDSLPINAVESLKSYSKTLLEADASRYSKSVLGSSSHKFLSTIVTSGTLSDKVSALTLAIQESPVHNVKAFETLLNLASKRSRGQAIGALGAIVDLLGPGLILPSSRRLRAFHSQPGLLGSLQQSPIQSWSPGSRLPGRITEGHLVSWIYEDWLKNAYFKVIQLLEVWCNDEIEYSRTRSLDFVFGLLKDKPEQETNLLRLLVNKLGDKDRKIASRVSYLLLQLQTAHPGMKQVIINAVEQEVLLRPGQGFRARYYAVNTLNQTILSNREPEIAASLLRIYFGMFVSFLNGQGMGRQQEDEPDQGKSTTNQPPTVDKSPSASAEKEVVEKMVSAILTGINRAVPFMAANDSILESHMDTLFRIAHSANFNTSIQALILIQQVSATRHIASDRFYRTLYESLLDPRLITSSKQALYLNLLLRALKGDVDSRRIKAFVKRMLQTANLHQPPFVCGTFYVVSQLQLQYPDLSALLYEPEDLNLADDHIPQLTDGKRELAGPIKHAPLGGIAVYDGRKRDPEHSNAHHSCLWEVLPSITHFHPSVSVFALGLLSDQEPSHKPELESHTLIRFLDKFVYRNPKATETSRGASIMQPVRRPSGSSSIWLGSKSSATTTGAVNSPAFWNKKAEQVAAEDVFFHEYFKQSRKPAQISSSKTESLDGPNNEDEIWKALTSSHPDGHMDSGSESDLAMDDFDDDSDQSILELEMGSSMSSGSVDETFDQESESDDGKDEVDSGDEPSDNLRSSLVQDRLTSRRNGGADAKSARKRLKDLPTFASADDYADLLAGEEDM